MVDSPIGGARYSTRLKECSRGFSMRYLFKEASDRQ